MMRVRRIWLLMVVLLLVGCANEHLTQTVTPMQVDPTPRVEWTVTVSATATLPESTLTPAPQSTPTARIRHLVTPESLPGAIDSIIQDPDSSPYSTSKMVAEGDHFDQGLFERPFNSESMDTYFPDLDIVQATLRRRGQWTYASIELHGFERGKIPSATYGIELDINQDGRGDFLILVTAPGLVWSTDRVQIWRDANRDVGGSVPVYSEPSSAGDGYEELIFDSGTGYDVDAAWARIAPDDLKVIQLAFKNAVIDNDRTYYWRAWAQTAVEPAWFDYNDHFTLAQAGSPLREQSQAYPLAGLAQVDNTCRWGMGVTPSADEPGICTAQLEQAATPEQMVLSGLVWYDRNTNFYQDLGEPGLGGAIIMVSRGECTNKGAVVDTQETQSGGVYLFTGLQPGHYCVEVSTPPPGDVSPVTGSGPASVILQNGKKSVVNFPYVVYK